VARRARIPAWRGANVDVLARPAQHAEYLKGLIAGGAEPAPMARPRHVLPGPLVPSAEQLPLG